jgi:hypothetical protein
MLIRIFTARYFWILFGLGLLLFLVFRKPIAAAIERRAMAGQTGQQAINDAATMNGYTRYNTAIYSPPSWFPFAKFFKANAYVTPGQAPIQQYSQGS